MKKTQPPKLSGCALYSFVFENRCGYGPAISD